MSDAEVARLVQLLREVETSRAGDRQGQVSDAESELSEVTDLADELRRRASAEEHLQYHKLQSLAQMRRDYPQRWVMPEHLSSCPVCLGIFELLMAGLPQPRRAALDRYARLWKPAALTIRPRGRRVPHAGWWSGALAASLLIAAAVGWFARAGNAARVQDDALMLASGQRLAPRAELPEARTLTAVSKSKTRFADGSEMLIEPRSRFSVIAHTRRTIVELVEGSLLLSVAKQSAGRRFEVSTQLGQIVVVGTRFSVSTRKVPVTVFHSGDAGASSREEVEKVLVVEVHVLEGKVAVKNKLDEVLATGGQTATIRFGQPKIDLSEDRL